MSPIVPRRWNVLFARTAFWSLLAMTSLTAAAASASNRVDFARDIQPILSAKCFPCHGPDEGTRKAKLRLDLRDEAVKPRKQGRFAIKPGDPSQSALVERILSTDPDEIMPPPKEGHPLSPSEIGALKSWIADGARYSDHWAFVKPVRPALPTVKATGWTKNGLDHFILAALEKRGLQPTPPADRPTLIRRLSLDLTGLPPSPEQVRAFVEDTSPGALERVVDRLLASPAYGERWARMWMDIARYADSAGYGSDPLRLNIWPYRDWVIGAFNRNLPYDRFSLEQIAGDLLDPPSEDQLIATAFHRNTMTNTEGGTDDEEWRVAAVKDRIAVTAQAWMGLTMACAQCHTHKFDPISQKEYYQFYALFNQTEDTDQPDERPTFPLYHQDQKQRLHSISNAIVALEKKRGEDTPELLHELSAWKASRAPGEHWVVLHPEQFSSTKGAAMMRLDDQSILVTNTAAFRDAYVVSAPLPMGKVTAFKLEALPHDSIPGNGPGHAGGNFVLNEFSAVFTPADAKPSLARFVRIELPGSDRMLSLAEVQVFSGGTNVALKGKASQSSTGYAGLPELAVDGKTDGNFEAAKSTTHTQSESNPWWEVDLGAETVVERITLWNRTDAGLGSRLDGARLLALDAKRAETFSMAIPKAAATNETYALDGSRALKFVAASADFSQSEYAVEKAIDGSLAQKSGWAVGSQTGKPHEAVFELSDAAGPGSVKFTLEHAYGDRQLLGRFRISATTDMAPVRVLPPEVRSALQRAEQAPAGADGATVRDWFRRQAKATAAVNAEIVSARKSMDELKPVPLPVMRELASDKRRTTRFLNKGSFLDPGEEVAPAIPAAFGPWPEGAPTNRLGVARWLFSPENPLTARVAVNRFWAQLFGTGLVETEEDFGTQGQLPSHPELLDWLAVTFASPKSENTTMTASDPQPSLGWDMKALIKLLVTSATYQQGARTTPELSAADPRNRLFARYPRRRLDAEMLHDQALSLSGLLTAKTGGPSVFPPQPDGLWKAAFNGERTYATSKGEDRYRRGLYTVWRRTVPYPSMSTFDAPSRETCTLRRLPTNTPLQAFVTLNDPVFVECAQSLARKIIREGGTAISSRVRYGLELVLSRPPSGEQENALLKLYETELKHYSAHQEEAVKLASQPLGPLPPGLAPAEAAAWTVVANILLNLDGVLTKG